MPDDHRYIDADTVTERIDRDLLLPASPPEVWEVITSDGWLAEHVELVLVPGGEARFTDRDSMRTGWVEEAAPPVGNSTGVLVFWWGPDGEPGTRVELTLAPEGEASTRLRVVESRPLEALELIGLTLPGQGGTRHGPSMLALA
ncbi:MAG TPA: hypothetical protein VGF70_00780 [Solirubrobacteraceae bacterium]|jgi:hypothetical protein